MIDSLTRIYQKNINYNLRDEIIKLNAKDQVYTSKVNNSYFIKYLVANKIWKEENRKIVENNLLALIKRYGFPAEKLIGIDSQSFMYQNGLIDEKRMLENISKGLVRFGDINVQYILIHYFSNPHQNFNEILLKEIEKGNLDPYQYASICDFQATILR